MTAPTHTPCCSSHGKDLDCETYRRTHFVDLGYCCSHDERRYPKGTFVEQVAEDGSVLYQGDGLWHDAMGLCAQVSEVIGGDLSRLGTELYGHARRGFPAWRVAADRFAGRTA